jgi:predicted transcriptional regulator
LTDDNVAELTADIVSSYVAANNVPPDQLADLIKSTYVALIGLGSEPAAPEAVKQPPAVSIKKSITPEYLISLEDGRKYKSLKRHLRAKYNMSPEQYRAKWGLPKDYPMVAPAYAASRSALAKAAGLGHGGGGAVKVAPTKATRKPRKSKVWAAHEGAEA